MLKQHFLLFALFVLALATRAVALERDLGSITIPIDVRSPSFISLLIQTNLNVVEHATVSVPTLNVKVTAESISNAVTLDTMITRYGSLFVVANLQGDTGVPVPPPVNPPPSSGGGSTAPSQGGSFAAPFQSGGVTSGSTSVMRNFSLAASVMVLLAMFLRLPSHLSFVLVAFASMAILPTVMAPIPPKVDLELRVPRGYSFDDVTITIAYGSVISSAALSTRSVELNLCGDSRNIINVDSLRVGRRLVACAGGQVTVSTLRQLSSALYTNFTSQSGAVSVSFSNTYVGTWAAQTSTGVVAANGGTCVNAASSGSCRGSVYPDSTIVAAASTGVALNFGPAGCSAAWSGDPEAEYVPPVSPSLAPARPAIITDLNAPSNWRLYTSWGALGGNSFTAVSGGIRADLPSYYPNDMYLYSMFSMSFRAGFTYSISMRFLATKSPTAAISPTVAWIQALAVDNPVWTPEWRINSTLWDLSFASKVFSAGPIITDVSNSTFTTVTGDFTVPEGSDITKPRVVIRIRFANDIWTSTWTLNFLDISLTRQPKVWSTPTLTAGLSEKAIIPKMPSTFDPNPRGVSDCPHLKAGLRHFHDASLWPGNAVPLPNSQITLPSNTSVLISSCSLADAVYNNIRIPPGSELIFSDAPMSLRIRNLLVEGKLHIGSPTCRLNSRVEITFVGPKSLGDEIATGFGTKGVGVVRSGSIDIHGFQYHPSWTRLAATILPGDDRIYLQDAVNWVVGQKIVVATSIYRDYENDQNEVATIVAISSDGKVVQVDPMFRFYHYGGAEYQSEVGLLTRRIVLQGDVASEVENFGGHVMVMGEGRFSGIQFYKMGQQNVLARYPVHWHLIGPSPQSFAKDNSFDNGYYRCISIHATHDTTVLRNVAWNNVAHCYYLEEGVEENNTISYNLAIHTRCLGPPMLGGGQRGEVAVEDDIALLPADRAAAGFYITNAYNTFIGNAASGGWAGFSFPNLPGPLGFNKELNFSPERRSLKIFDGNTVHSSGYHFNNDGGCIYVGGRLWYNASVLTYDSGRFSRYTSTRATRTGGYGPPDWMKFTNVKAWMCQLAISHWGDRAEVTNLETHDVIRSVQLFGESWLAHSLYNAKSDSVEVVSSMNRAFQFYDTFVQTMLTDMEFRNIRAKAGAEYYSNQNSVILSMVHSDRFKPQGISATSRLTFTNVDRQVRILHGLQNTGSSRYFNLIDWDGSLTERTGPQIVGSASAGDWWKISDACVLESAWNVWVCPKDADREIGNLEITVPISVPNPISSFPAAMVHWITDWNNGPEYPPDTDDWKVGSMTLWGPGIPQGRKTAVTRNSGVTGVTKMGWYLYVQQGTPRIMKVATYVIPNGQFIMFAVRYPASCTTEVWISHDSVGSVWRSVTAVNSFAQVLNGNGTQSYRDNEFLFLKLKVLPYNNRDPSTNGFERGGVKIYDVYYSQAYNIRATCPGTTPNFLPVDDVEPVGYWT